MTTNRDRALRLLNDLAENQDDGVGVFDAVTALADAGLLTPDRVPLEPGDRSFVIDRLMGNLQRANVLGSPGMAEAWGAAANAFAAATREKE